MSHGLECGLTQYACCGHVCQSPEGVLQLRCCSPHGPDCEVAKQGCEATLYPSRLQGVCARTRVLVYVKERREGEREGGWQTQRGGEGFPEQGFSADSKDPGLGHFFLTREKPGGLGVNVPS